MENIKRDSKQIHTPMNVIMGLKDNTLFSFKDKWLKFELKWNSANILKKLKIRTKKLTIYINYWIFKIHNVCLNEKRNYNNFKRKYTRLWSILITNKSIFCLIGAFLRKQNVWIMTSSLPAKVIAQYATQKRKMAMIARILQLLKCVLP